MHNDVKYDFMGYTYIYKLSNIYKHETKLQAHHERTLSKLGESFLNRRICTHTHTHIYEKNMNINKPIKHALNGKEM